MPRVRHYSWPFSGPSTTKTDASDPFFDARSSRWLKRRPSLEEAFQRRSNPDGLDPFPEDDIFSAGIDRSTSTRQLKRRRFHRDGVSEAHRDMEVIVSSITEADELPTAMLRRIVWPRLEKARHLLPSHSTTLTATVSRKNKATLSCQSMPSLPEGLVEEAEAESGYLRPRPGRRHRRCHSEQPRAWREPSPDLWTLPEE
jgi:hypothetical protein